MRILIANRGEIARRIIATAHRLGHETVAAYADPDRDAPFVADATMAVRIGPADLSQSYLSVDRLMAAVAAAGADAVHPGYGFLAENAGFARAVEAAGCAWIGPHPGAIEAMGSKIEARRLAVAAGVPTIPGYDASQDPTDLAKAADEIGYPVLVKAAAGGGGKGIRIVTDPAGFAAGLSEAATEAERSFGDRAVIVERYVRRSRHVEVQVIGDRHRSVIHLGTRECSLQRRYQKVLEEAPAPNLPEATRTGLQDAAVQLAAAIGYDSAGTVEFIVDDETAEFFFLEMNTRLQVEHPVTEAVTGLDIVELQLRVAEGERLPVAQDEVTFSGHAFEARINAEDAAADFAPQTGSVTHLVVPDGVRWDSGVVRGTTITPHYDPMVAKLVVEGPDRPSALRNLRAALDGLVIGGVTTNAGFHRWLVDQPLVIAGRATTRFLDDAELPDAPAPALAESAAAWHAATVAGRRGDVWHALGSFRVTPHAGAHVVALRAADDEVHEIALERDSQLRWLEHAVEIASGGTLRRIPASVDVAMRSVAVTVNGHAHTFSVPTRSERWAPSMETGHGHAHAVAAPFPAAVTEVLVSPGQQVAGGEALVVIEAMKMLHTLNAAGPGVVAEVRVAVGSQVESHQILITFEHNPAGGEPGVSTE